MKCALELTAMKVVANEQYTFEQMLLDEKCKLEHAQIVAASIDFCETVIGPALEERALDRLPICYSLRGDTRKDRLGNFLISPLVRQKRSYANGHPSEYADFSQTYDVFTIKDYLEKHCLKVKLQDEWYKRYGFGDLRGVKLTVTV